MSTMSVHDGCSMKQCNVNAPQQFTCMHMSEVLWPPSSEGEDTCSSSPLASGGNTSGGCILCCHAHLNSTLLTSIPCTFLFSPKRKMPSISYANCCSPIAIQSYCVQPTSQSHHATHIPMHAFPTVALDCSSGSTQVYSGAKEYVISAVSCGAMPVLAAAARQHKKGAQE